MNSHFSLLSSRHGGRAALLIVALTAVSLGVTESSFGQTLSGYWNFNETSGGTAFDDIGSADAIWQNGTSTNLNWVGGQIGNAADLGGGGADKFIIGSDPLAGTSALTISVWANPDSIPGGSYKGVITSRINPPSSNGNNWGMAVEEGPNPTGTGHIDYRWNGGAHDSPSNGVSPSNAGADNGWYHFAQTWDTTGTRRSYLNGNLVAQDTSGPGSYVSNGFWFVGDDACCGGREFNGQIDDLAMAQQALSGARIERIYNGGLAGRPVFDTNQAVNTTNQFLWNIPGNGAWGDASTWDLNADYPNLPGDVVFFIRDHAPNVDRLVSLNVADADAHRIVFDDPGSNAVDAGWIITPTSGQSITMTVTAAKRGHLESYNHATNVVNAPVNMTGTFDEAYTLIDPNSTIHLAEGLTYTSPGASSLSARLSGKLILGGTSDLDRIRVRNVDGRPAAVNVDVDGGTLTLNRLSVEARNGGTGTFDVVNGGSLTITGAGSQFNVGGGGAFGTAGGNGTGEHTLTLSDTSTITSNAPLTLAFATNNNDATAQLNGGTLKVPQIRKGSGTGLARVQLNGVTIVPTGNHADFMTTDLTTRIWDGGVTFDTDGFDITVNSFLGNQSGATTSQLRKIGAGTLTLTDANNNYRGGTVISEGVLQAGADFVLPDDTSAGNTTINSPGTLDLNGFRTTTNVLLGDGTIDNTGGTRNWVQPGSNNGSGTFSGNIQSTGAFTDIMKVGSGEQVFTGNVDVGTVWARGGTTTFAAGSSLTTAESISVNPSNGGVSSTLQITGGNHDITNWTFVGNSNDAFGHFIQSAGTYDTDNMSIGQQQSGDLNTATISGGTLNVGRFFVGNGGDGRLTVSNTAELNVAGGDFTVGNAGSSNGEILLNGGTISSTAPDTIIANNGDGTVTQSGSSTFNNAGDMTVGAAGGTGTYTLNSGTLNFGDTAAPNQAASGPASTLEVGGNGTFNFNGGTLMNVTTIDHSAGSTGDTLTQNGGNLVVGVDGGLDPQSTATTRATTNIVGNYTTLPGATLSLDIFGNEPGDYFPGSLPGEGVSPIPSLSIDDVLNADPTASDLLIVGNADGTGLGVADFTAGLTLDLDLNGLDAPFLGYYDLVLAQEILLDEDTFNINGASLYRIVELADGSQLLQAAVPEPASIALWSLLGIGLIAFARFRRKAKNV